MVKRRSSRSPTPPPSADLADLKRGVEREYARLLSYGPSREADIFGHAARMLLDHDNPAFYQAVRRLNTIPVPIAEFAQSPEFLGNVLEIWPALLPDLEASNPDVVTGAKPVHEVYLGGATGWGKTTIAQVTSLYQLYLLTCFDDVQGLFSLSSGTSIIMSLQSVTPKVAARVLYEPFRRYFESMPYAQEHLRWNPNRTTALELSNRIIVTPEVANIQANIGQADIGGILDEVNFMSVVERSTRVPGPRGLGGSYDQAEEIYRHRSRRRRSRFTTQGISIGTLCVLSSTRYEGDFLARRMDEVERFDEQNVVVVCHSQYEVAPRERYSGETFRLQVGNQNHPTRILDDDEATADGLQVEQVPVEYRGDFQRDPENALRDIVGIASTVIRPFIDRRNKILDAIVRGRELELHQWVNKPEVDLAIDGLPRWNEEALPEDRRKPRFIHVDPSLTRDRCGVAIVKVAGNVNQSGVQSGIAVETHPYFVVETAFTIQPSPAAELEFGELRQLLMQLKTRYRLNVRAITYDGYQSRESIQLLRRWRIRSYEISVDRTMEPYDYLRRALYQDRVAMVENELLMLELSQLEINEEKRKVDHPPRGSKDLADAVAGAVFSAADDRRIRAGTGPVDPDGPRQRPRRSEPLRRRGSNLRKVMEERDAQHRAAWEESLNALKKLYG